MIMRHPLLILLVLWTCLLSSGCSSEANDAPQSTEDSDDVSQSTQDGAHDTPRDAARATPNEGISDAEVHELDIHTEDATGGDERAPEPLDTTHADLNDGDITPEDDGGPDAEDTLSDDLGEPETNDTAEGDTSEATPDGDGSAIGDETSEVATETDDDAAEGDAAEEDVPEVIACIPECTALECGDDGCGGSCGTCEAGSSCSPEQLCQPLSIEAQLEALLVDTYGLDQLTNALDLTEIDAQDTAYPSSVNIVSALDKAMTSFLNDDSDLESPLGIAYFVAEGTWDPNNPEGQSFEEAIKEALMDHLNRPTAQISLVPIGSNAEYGESVVDNWIFFLTIDDMSDHLYWAIVDRDGVNATYNYGFN